VWVVYRKATKQVVGLTANTAIDVDKSTALNAIVEGLLEKKPIQEYDAILVQDLEQASDYMAAFPDKLVLGKGKGGLRVVIREPEAFSLHVTCDAPDRHPVDRIPTIPGDGQSFTTLTIQVIDERSVAQRAERHRDVLYLRTDHGTLRDSQGVNDISSVQLQNGSAAIRLVSGQIKRVATVQILSADQSVRSADFRVEFT
jgi:hypothetical protein